MKKLILAAALLSSINATAATCVLNQESSKGQYDKLLYTAEVEVGQSVMLAVSNSQQVEELQINDSETFLRQLERHAGNVVIAVYNTDKADELNSMTIGTIRKYIQSEDEELFQFETMSASDWGEKGSFVAHVPTGLSIFCQD